MASEVTCGSSYFHLDFLFFFIEKKTEIFEFFVFPISFDFSVDCGPRPRPQPQPHAHYFRGNIEPISGRACRKRRPNLTCARPIEASIRRLYLTSRTARIPLTQHKWGVYFEKDGPNLTCTGFPRQCTSMSETAAKFDMCTICRDESP